MCAYIFVTCGSNPDSFESLYPLISRLPGCSYTLPGMLRVTSDPLHAPPMPQYHRNSSATTRPSPLANDVGNPGVESVNELLSPPAQSQLAEPKTQPIWITSDSPPRPPRRSRRRPQTAPHPSLSSFDTRNDTHGLLPIILQFPDSPKHPSKIDELRPSSLPPTTLPHSYSPIKNTGFLNRVPKRIQIDDDSANTSSSILTRRPSVPTLKSYIGPSMATTSNPSRQFPRSALLRREPSLASMDAGRPVAEVRSRAKSSIAFSEVVLARRKDRSADLNTDDKMPTVSPLSFTRLRTTSETSLSPPVTTSTLNDESRSSLTVYESLQEEETEKRQDEEPRTKKKPLWDMTEAKVHSDSTDKKMLIEPKPSHLLTFQSLGSTLQLGASGSPPKPEVRPDKEVTGERDEKTQTGMTGGKATPHRTGGTIRKVWRSIVGRK